MRALPMELLYNQTGWDSNYQTATWNVDATQGLVSTSDEWKRAAWGQEFALSGAGDQITFRVDLNFTGNLTAQNNPMIKIGFSSSSAVSTSNPPQIPSFYQQQMTVRILQEGHFNSVTIQIVLP